LPHPRKEKIVIETDDQRRWWFATHPEYSWSRRGNKTSGPKHDKEAAEKVRPEDVDAYVDNALKYADGDVAYLLKSVKRHFGTESASTGPTDGSATSGWETEAGGATGSRPGRGSRRGLEIRDWHHRSREERRARDLVEYELEQAGANRHDYRLNSFAGRHAAQRDRLYDRDQVDPQGRTNIQRMRDGEAPLDRSGHAIELHHANQLPEGPIVEMTRGEHQSMRVRRDPSQIDRPDARNFRESYWRARAASVGRPTLQRFHIR